MIGIYLEFSNHPPHICNPIIFDYGQQTIYLASAGHRRNLGQLFILRTLMHAMHDKAFRPKPRNTYCSLCFKSLYVNHIAHSLYNSFSFIHDFMKESVKENVLGNVIFYIEGDSHLWPITELVPSCSRISEEEAINSNILLTPQGNYISRQISKKIISDGLRKFSSYQLDQNIKLFLQRSRFCFPIILLSLRPSMKISNIVFHGRSQPKNQVDALIIYIQKIREVFPNLAVIIDGALGKWDKVYTDTSNEDYINDINHYFNDLLRYLEKENIDHFSILGKPTPVALALDQLVDVFVSPLGSGLSRHIWISELNGIVYASYRLIAQDNQRVWQGSNMRNSYSRSTSKIKYILIDEEDFTLSPKLLFKHTLDLIGHASRTNMY